MAVRIGGGLPPGVRFYVGNHDRKKTRACFLQIWIEVVRFDEAPQQVFRAVDVLGTFRDQAWRHRQYARNWLAVIAERNALRDDLLEVLIGLLHLRDRNRD